jgi:carbamoyltransferase
MEANILGISAYYHDSAAALISNGNIVAAAQEERFTRKKHDASFPAQAIQYCLDQAKLSLNELDGIVYYDKPLVTFERLLETYLDYAPRGFSSFIKSMPVWLQDKLFLKKLLKRDLATLGKLSLKKLPPVLFSEHHKSHAASAFYPSPFSKAAVLCLDGVGEWATTSVWLGEESRLEAQWQIDFPHSLGLLYSAFTYYTGFKVNSGEYKLMGLAPYGEPCYEKLIREHLIDIKPDGSFRLDMRYFDYAVGLKMTNKRFDALFGAPARKPESEITQRDMNIARSIQVITEDIVLRLARSIHQELNVDNLCLAGGVALNCVANGRLLREGPFKNIWIQPAAGDAGGSIGAALLAYYDYFNNKRTIEPQDGMQGAYLGPAYSDKEIQTYLDATGAHYQRLETAEIIDKTAELLASGNVIGWFQGRMEFGPRALGNRSIIGDPRNANMQSTMNLKIKYRESFRPFAPAVKLDKASDWFDLNTSSPYMLLVAPVNSSKCKQMTVDEAALFGIEKLNSLRSSIPAVTHIDYSARVQTVDPHTNANFYHLLDAFERKTNCPVLINTSFNVRGEPIVCSPKDAYCCFMRTEMDYLILGNYLLPKLLQPAWKENSDWRQVFTLD